MPEAVSANDKLKKAGFKKEEFDEIEAHVFDRTGFPAPAEKFRFVWATPNVAIEDVYYWILDHLKQTWGVHRFDKIIDLQAASENSALFGMIQQRLSLQQEKVSQFMAVIGKMIKELFQLVREIRILDERLHLYEIVNHKSKGYVSADISLKGVWVDLVEGGSKNPSSIYGMATQVGFRLLPDVFFATFVDKPENVDKVVESLDFNRKLKEVLRRKLMSYLIWKEHTYQELKSRRLFTIKYLRQHYTAIKMYMEWIKPYLRNIKRLQLSNKLMDNAEVVSSFDASVMEVEFLGIKEGVGGKKGDYYPCVLATFEYSTKPALNFHAEGYQRGPIHIGLVEVNLRAYAWTEEDIKNYKKYRDEEAFEVLTEIDSSLKSAMDALGDELNKYISEHEESVGINKKKEEKEEAVNYSDPFTSVFKGFGELFSALVITSPIQSKEKKEELTRDELAKMEADRKSAAGTASTIIWNTYKNFKKSHKPDFMAW
ncbi:MAG: hypothetical protein GWP10_14360 [Nitrospiraceae bacterium]|nr:hypothetical protein [Nitrospiraceae bacterium]